MGIRITPMILAAALAAGISGVATAGDTPSTRPAAAVTPESARRTELEKSFDQLSDADPSVRSKARIELMGVELSDLELLRDIVSRRKTAAPQQLTLLHDIVRHVWLARHPLNEKTPILRKGFLGITLNTARSNLEDPGEGDEAIVCGRIPGCVAYQMLEDGDIILGFQGQNRTFRQREVVDTIQSFTAGDRVVLRVQRNGAVIEVPVILSALPPAENDIAPLGGIPSKILRERLPRAEAYWNEHFAPLIGESAT